MAYLLQIRTQESYSFKILAELLQNCLKEAAFIVDSKGFHLSCVDGKSEMGTMCINMHLDANNFRTFHCSRENFVLGLNLLHFYRMLKSIKKKEILTLEIFEDTPQDLYIIVNLMGELHAGAMRSKIKVSNVEPQNVCAEEEYGKPIVCPAKEFSKLRCFHRVDNVITMRFTTKWVKFKCNNGELLSREVFYGEKDTEKTDNEEIHTQTYDADTILRLVKIAGLSTNIQIYAAPDIPLKVQMNVGSLGTLKIMLKSLEQLDRESSNEDNDEDDGEAEDDQDN